MTQHSFIAVTDSYRKQRAEDTVKHKEDEVEEEERKTAYNNSLRERVKDIQSEEDVSYHMLWRGEKKGRKKSKVTRDRAS